MSMKTLPERVNDNVESVISQEQEKLRTLRANLFLWSETHLPSESIAVDDLILLRTQRGMVGAKIILKSEEYLRTLKIYVELPENDGDEMIATMTKEWVAEVVDGQPKSRACMLYRAPVPKHEILDAVDWVTGTMGAEVPDYGIKTNQPKEQK